MQNNYTMNILYYEFMDASAGSYNGILGELVRRVRIYCDTPSNQLDALKPKIFELAKALETIDESFSGTPRDYLTEIMEALSKEQEVYQNFMDSLPFACDAVFLALFDKKADREEYQYEYNNERGEHFVQFFGYRDKKEETSELQVMREVLRAHCYRHNIIFIDSSLQ